jgi:3D (Asp-Asp-Asp) domain-containing protein
MEMAQLYIGRGQVITLKAGPARRRLIVVAAAVLFVLTVATLAWYFTPLPVTVTFDGQTHTYRLHRGTVATALHTLGLAPGLLDQVAPQPETRLAKGMNIRIVRVTEKTVEEDATIPHPVSARDNPGLSAGIVEVIKAGVDGKEHRTVKETYQDGQLVQRDVIASAITREPVTEQIVQGTGRSVTISRGGIDYRSRRVLTVVATAYDPTVGTTTYTGTSVKLGIVAVDPRVIPLGSRLYIDGYGYGVAADIGGAIKGNRIDVATWTVGQAKDFGVQHVKVYVVSKGHKA